MDSFSDAQLRIMKAGGNRRCEEYLSERGLDESLPIREKYLSSAAALYREVLGARRLGVGDGPGPTESNDDTPPLTRGGGAPGGPPASPPGGRAPSFANESPPPSFVGAAFSSLKMYLFWFIAVPLRKDRRLARLMLGGLSAFGAVALSDSRLGVLSREVSVWLAYLGAGCSLLMPCLGAHVWRTKRLPAFKSVVDDFAERVRGGRAKRNPGYDLFFPPGCTIGSKVDRALLFYPGIFVDHMAYAMILARLSDRGVLVVLANLEPTRVASKYTATGATAGGAKKVFHEIRTLLGIQVGEWVVGGHSLGSHAASDIIEELPAVSRLVMWGSGWTARSFCDSDVSVLVVNASNDGVVEQMCNEKHFRANLPSEDGNTPGKMTYHLIKDGNHSGFGHYGPQFYPVKDYNRTITLDEQQKECVEVMANFILGQCDKKDK